MGSTSGASAKGFAASGSRSKSTGLECKSHAECLSKSCLDGQCADAAGLSTTTIAPQFSGSEVSFRPLTTGGPPSTRDACTGSCEASGGDPNVTVIRPPATLCFWASSDETPEDPATVIEQVIESVGGQSYVHIRVTFDPSFTDSTY